MTKKLNRCPHLEGARKNPKPVGVDPARRGPQTVYFAEWGRTPAGGRRDEEGGTPFPTE
jgi:hypothetical protein